jgi:predicted lipoprotein with Yx(FWY)xxD motif
MKRVTIGFLALLLTTGVTLAADPWKTMKTALGDVQADAKGMTLYQFDKDAAGISNCNGDCAAMWPPFVSDPGSKATGDWTIVTRKDGAHMWAYDGKPVYTYSKDKKPGDVLGDGVGGLWHAAK